MWLIGGRSPQSKAYLWTGCPQAIALPRFSSFRYALYSRWREPLVRAQCVRESR